MLDFLRDKPLTQEETTRLLRLIGDSDMAQQASESNRKYTEEERHSILDSIPHLQKLADFEATKIVKAFSILHEEKTKIQQRLLDMQQEYSTAQQRASHASQSADSIADLNLSQVRKLADPRIQRVIAWLETCMGITGISWHYSQSTRTTWRGDKVKQAHSNWDEINTAVSSIQDIHAELQNMQISKYDPATIEDKLREIATEVPKIMATVPGFDKTRVPKFPSIAYF